MTRLGMVSAAALVLSMGGAAWAQSFDGVAQKARPVDGDRALGALFWSQEVSCGKAGGELEKRQCEAVRDARKRSIAGATYLTQAEPGSVSVGSFDAKTKSLSLTVRACLACAKPVDAGTTPLVIIGGAPTPDHGKIVSAPLTTAHVTLASPTAAKKFSTEVAPRLRTEILFQLGDKPARWKAGGAQGYKVTIAGYRVVDPCTGAVYAASPKSGTVAPDKRACGDQPAQEAEPDKPAETKPAEPQLPRRLSSDQIRDALQPARDAARKCYEAFGIAGTARFKITISNDGEVVGLRQTGDFTGTPTGDCVAKAVKKTVFPKSQKAHTSIDYPFILR